MKNGMILLHVFLARLAHKNSENKSFVETSQLLQNLIGERIVVTEKQAEFIGIQIGLSLAGITSDCVSYKFVGEMIRLIASFEIINSARPSIVIA